MPRAPLRAGPGGAATRAGTRGPPPAPRALPGSPAPPSAACRAALRPRRPPAPRRRPPARRRPARPASRGRSGARGRAGAAGSRRPALGPERSGAEGADAGPGPLPARARAPRGAGRAGRAGRGDPRAPPPWTYRRRRERRPRSGSRARWLGIMGMARPSSGGGARPGRTPARRARAHLPAAAEARGRPRSPARTGRPETRPVRRVNEPPA